MSSFSFSFGHKRRCGSMSDSCRSFELEDQATSLLDWIEGQTGGVRLISMQIHLWEDIVKKKEPFTPSRSETCRTFWTTHLYTANGHPGLLEVYCTKSDDGLYRRNDIRHNRKPFQTIRDMRSVR